MNIRNEIKSQIIRAGFTMQEALDRLAGESHPDETGEKL